VSAFSEWESFYVIVGSSAGGLTGLQFVVAALVADSPHIAAWSSSSPAFATPTIVHFSVVLVLSGLFSAPWESAGPPMAIVGLGGVAGVIYALYVAYRARALKEYRAVFEDWLFHVVLPAVAYLTFIVSALETRLHVGRALFGVAAAVMLLLIVGIHNAWDSVTFIVARREQEKRHGRH